MSDEGRDRYRPDRPLYCGNFEYDASEREIVRLFERYGKVDKIDLKTGFAFIYMMDKRDAEDALRDLDGSEFGYKRRRLKIEWASQRESDRKRDTRPSKTLFVVNFDTRTTTERDLEEHFSPYGRLVRVEIKKNYAFVQYETFEESAKAFAKTNQSMVRGRTLSVEYTQNEGPSAGAASLRSRSPSPRRRRSPSPAPRGRRYSPSPAPRGRRYSPSPAPRRGRSPAGRSRSRSLSRGRSYSR